MKSWTIRFWNIFFENYKTKVRSQALKIRSVQCYEVNWIPFFWSHCMILKKKLKIRNWMILELSLKMFDSQMIWENFARRILRMRKEGGAPSRFSFGNLRTLPKIWFNLSTHPSNYHSSNESRFIILLELLCLNIKAQF